MDSCEVTKQILSNYNFQTLNKIQDFLLSEIDEDNLQETIDFVNANDIDKKGKYKDILYTDGKYKGLFLEGNQYLISSSQNEVLLLDVISEENEVSEKYTRISLTKADFIELISNKKQVMELIRKMRESSKL